MNNSTMKHYTIRNFICTLLALAAMWALCWVAVFKVGFQVQQLDANDSFLFLLVVTCTFGASLFGCISAFLREK